MIRHPDRIVVAAAVTGDRPVRVTAAGNGGSYNFSLTPRFSAVCRRTLGWKPLQRFC